jgi:hypothetical protein
MTQQTPAEQPGGSSNEAEATPESMPDRTLSPQYSSAESRDPAAIWQGRLVMANVADIRMVAKFAGGANLKQLIGVDWDNLILPTLNVAGRVPEDKATQYICGLRFESRVDLVITSLNPTDSSDPKVNSQFLAVVDYFQSKQRYGVTNEKKFSNMKDTYLVPVSAGDGPLPEFLLQIEGHLVPRNRPAPILLAIFIVQDEKITIDQPVTLGEEAQDFCGPFGLNLLHSPPEPLIDLVFVHGVGGGSIKTWCYHNDPKLLWPKYWLPEEPGMRHVNIHSFGYDANLIDKGLNNVLNVNDIGQTLLEAMGN